MHQRPVGPLGRDDRKGREDRGDRPRGLAWGHLRSAPAAAVGLWLTLVVLWLVWSPWGPVTPRVLLSPPRSVAEILLNLLLLVPLGLLVAASGRDGGRGGSPAGRASRPVRYVALGFGAGLLFAMVLEAGQLLLPFAGRAASPFDVVLNATGAATGVWVGLGARERRIGASALALSAAAGVFLLAAGYAAWTGRQAVQSLRLVDWEAGYGLLAGDEFGGGRAYRGLVRQARLCAGPPGADVCAEPGAVAAVRRQVVDAAERHQRFRFEALVRADDGGQAKDARIVSFSGNTDVRNTHLAQWGAALHLRVRTPRMGPNGTRVEYLLPAAVEPGVPTRVTAEFHRGRVQMAAEAAAGRRSGTFPMNVLTGWWYVRPRWWPVAPGHLLAAASAGALILFLPFGLLAGRLLPGRGVVAVGVAAAGGWILLLVMDRAVGAVTGLPEAGLAAAAAALGVPAERVAHRLGARRRP